MEEKATFKKVMVIDDTYVDRYIAERNIRKHYFAEEVVLMESAGKALEYLNSIANDSEELPQLIFLDIRMPEIDGFGFLEEYEKLSEMIKSNCIVMMLSTSLNQEDHDRASQNPYVKQFLCKPLNKEKIESIVIQKNM